MDVSGREGPVVAGVFPGQRAAVVTEAAALARLIDRPLLCVYVAPDTFLTEWDRADVRVAASLHPTDIGAADGQAAMKLSAAITATLQSTEALPQDWTLRILAGDPSRAIARVADEVDASLVVVGTHASGFGRAVEEWVSGSVAVHLSRALRCSIVVVPVGRERADRAVLA